MLSTHSCSYTNVYITHPDRTQGATNKSMTILGTAMQFASQDESCIASDDPERCSDVFVKHIIEYSAGPEANNGALADCFGAFCKHGKLY